MRIVLHSLLALLVLSCAVLRPPSYELGTISGVVLREADLAPLAGMTVRSSGTRDSAVTDSGGYFRLTSVPPGRRNIGGTLAGYRDAGLAGVEVARNATTCTLLFASPGRGRAGRAAARASAPPQSSDPPTAPLVMVNSTVRSAKVLAESFSIRKDGLLSIREAMVAAIPRANIVSLEVVQPAASAAMFGARGARGAIVLSTRSQAYCY